MLRALVLLAVWGCLDATPTITSWNDLRCTFDLEPCFQRTIILIQKPTNPDQYLYLKGGRFGDGQGIPIRHRIRPTHPDSYYAAMSTNDNNLTWTGAEPNQGQWHGEVAQGTPMIWTTNQKDYPEKVEVDGVGYHSLNDVGPNLWLVDVDMDCNSLGEAGLFEFKGFIKDRRTGEEIWEGSNVYRKKCGHVRTQSRDGNHVGQCGMLNAVQFDGSGCDIVSTIVY